MSADKITMSVTVEDDVSSDGAATVTVIGRYLTLDEVYAALKARLRLVGGIAAEARQATLKIGDRNMTVDEYNAIVDKQARP